MPTPTISETSGGLSPCWIATIAPPICGPIAASNNVTRASDLELHLSNWRGRS
jgi:hypothetical protein